MALLKSLPLAFLALLYLSPPAEAQCKYGFTRFSYLVTGLPNTKLGQAKQHWQETMGACSPRTGRKYRIEGGTGSYGLTDKPGKRGRIKIPGGTGTGWDTYQDHGGMRKGGSHR